jgi:patatin-like phospholipase/acyl hydrolase
MTKYVLSIDGGGVRGLASANFLSKLDKKIPKKLSESFDLLVGTSTGGIISLAISILDLEGEDLVKIYSKENLKKIFSPFRYRILGSKYAGKIKRKTFDEYFGAEDLGSSKVPLIITAFDLEKRRVKMFKSWKEGYLPARRVAAATSAAPTYFPAESIEGKWYLDGAVSTNNPVLIAYSEAKKLWPNEDIKILSVGTGYNSKRLDGKRARKWGSLAWLNAGIIQILMESNIEHVIAQSLFEENYLRVDSELSGIESSFDNTSKRNLDSIKALGDRWWDLYGKKAEEFISS